MAAEVDRWSLSDRIDACLARVAAAWAGVPVDAAEWDEWDWESRLVYRFGWTGPQDDWDALERWAADGLLTPEQRCRFEEIKPLMEAHGAILARLLDPDSDRNMAEQSPTGTAAP